jgi:deazaflavin-dependent oxidoreductase (nitroreductase family)
VTSDESTRRLRIAFGYLNRFMIALWRLGLGGWINLWPAVGGRVMVLVNIGRRTGLERRTPLNYAIIGGDIYCISGFGRIADWHKNIVANPHVEVWLPDGWWAGVATDISDSESRLTVLRQVLIASGFASYLAGIWPKSASDTELAEATADYGLFRIERTQSLAPKSGPGDLLWIWPIATFALLIVLLLL